MSTNCEHDATTYDVDEGRLAKYLVEGADLLEDAEFGFASLDNRSQPHLFDRAYWVIGHDWHRNANVNVLVPKSGVKPSRAVEMIFAHPDRWSFDCSQFVQVVTLYGWLKLLGPAKFDRRVQDCGRQGIQITPFQGSVFARPQRRFWRERRDEWMKDLLEKGGQPRLTVREIVDAAPVGSRVMFRNAEAARRTDFFNENAIKVGLKKYVAHGFGETSLSEDDITLELFRCIPGKEHATLLEARRHVWIKEVDYFLDRVTFTRAHYRMMIQSGRAMRRIMQRL